MYRTAFNYFYRLQVSVMRTIIETTVTVMFIVISWISLIQSGIFSSYYSSVFPTATAVYAFQKRLQIPQHPAFLTRKE